MRRFDHYVQENTPTDSSLIFGHGHLTKMMKNLNLTPMYRQPVHKRTTTLLQQDRQYDRFQGSYQQEEILVMNRPNSGRLCKRSSTTIVNNVNGIKRKIKDTRSNVRTSEIYSSSSGQFSADSSDKTHLEDELIRLKKEIESLKQNKEKLSKRVDEEAHRCQMIERVKAKTIEALSKQNAKSEFIIKQLQKDRQLKTAEVQKKDVELTNLRRLCQRTLNSRSNGRNIISGRMTKCTEDKEFAKSEHKHIGVENWKTIRGLIAAWNTIEELRASVEAEKNLFDKQRSKLENRKIKLVREEMLQYNGPSKKRKSSDMFGNIDANLKYVLQQKSKCEQHLKRLAEESCDPLACFKHIIEKISSTRELKVLLSNLFRYAIEKDVEANRLQSLNKLLEQENHQFEHTKLLRLNAMQSVISQTDSNYDIDEIILAPVLNEATDESDEEFSVNVQR